MSNTKVMKFEELTAFIEEQNDRGEIYDALVVVVEDLVCMFEVSTSFKPNQVEAIYEKLDQGHLITMRLYHTENQTTVANRYWNGVLVLEVGENNEVVSIRQAYVTLLEKK